MTVQENGCWKEDRVERVVSLFQGFSFFFNSICLFDERLMYFVQLEKIKADKGCF